MISQMESFPGDREKWKTTRKSPENVVFQKEDTLAYLGSLASLLDPRT